MEKDHETTPNYPNRTRRWYRPVEHECSDCHRKLREVKTLSKCTVITLREVIKVTHAGYRCPDAQCPGHQRTYRSVEADALTTAALTLRNRPEMAYEARLSLNSYPM